MGSSILDERNAREAEFLRRLCQVRHEARDALQFGELLPPVAMECKGIVSWTEEHDGAPQTKTAEAAEPFCVLGDIVISLETVEARCAGDLPATREEVRLLFCHGLLHLLGFVHDTKSQRARMQAKQAKYLGVAESAAWRSRPL